MPNYFLPLTLAVLPEPPDTLADPATRDYLRLLRDQLQVFLNDLAHGSTTDHEANRGRWLSCYIDSLGAGQVRYFLGTAAAALIFPRDAVARRLTVQANVGAGATLTVTCYNGAEAAGNIVFQSVSGVGAGRVALEDVTPNNSGMEIFRSSDAVNPGDKCFLKVDSSGGPTDEISIELEVELQ